MMPNPLAPVLILGAGVNGICVARELVLNRVPVWIVDTSDIAFGATAKSSRLIHGGLRYLEYGDFSLVAESLHERDRLLRLAPQFVRPLRLHIPIRRRMGGFIAAGLRFLGLSRTRLGRWIGSGGGRGLWTVRCGLWLYDLLARSGMVPRHEVHRTGQAGPSFPADQFPWSCSYYDAQMERPERFCIAMLRDIEAAAKETGTEFRLMTYHRAVLTAGQVEISPTRLGHMAPVQRLVPSLIINATGAWGDFTLKGFPVAAPRLFGGTKGTHLFTSHSGLLQALGGDAVYAEAADGRLVFLIPLEQGVMIGTTDERFDQSPEEARSTEAEVDYLLQLTGEIFPQVKLDQGDVYATCAGIRPLPSSDSAKTASISRGHSIDERMADGIKVMTLIGGKLTTCRAFGEEVADHVLKQLSLPRSVSTRDRIIPGGVSHPPSAATLETWLQEKAAETGYPVETCQAMYRLVGTDVPSGQVNDRRLIDREATEKMRVPGTALPCEFVRHIIETEWVTTLEDLIERRLLLAFEPHLTQETLIHLAKLLAESNTSDSSVDTMVESARLRLQTFYGRQEI